MKLFEDELVGIIEGHTVGGEKRDEKKECEKRNFTSEELVFIARKGDDREEGVTEDAWNSEEIRDKVLAHVAEQTNAETKEADEIVNGIVAEDKPREPVAEEAVAEEAVAEEAVAEEAVAEEAVSEEQGGEDKTVDEVKEEVKEELGDTDSPAE